MEQRARRGDKQGVEHVPGEGHPGIRQNDVQFAEIVHGRIAHEEAGRKHENLIQRLEGIDDDIHQRQSHEHAYGAEKKKIDDVAAAGTIGHSTALSALNSPPTHLPTLLSSS